jgi:hypothetical protein
MNFFKKLFSGGSSASQRRYFAFQVKCKRCGEIIEGHVDTSNDLSVEYEPGGDIFYARKVLIGDGSKHCYQQIEVGMKFDKDRRLIEKTIVGGTFVENQ